MEFRLAKHGETGEDLVEVWRDGTFVAGIYEHAEGLHVVSKYYDGVEHGAVYPPSVVVKLAQ